MKKFKCLECDFECCIAGKWTICQCGEVYETDLMTGLPVQTGRNIQRGDSVAPKRIVEDEVS